MYNQILLTNILRLIEELGINKKNLAERSGVSTSFMSDLTHDKANPSLRIMESIADALETPLPALLELTNIDKEIVDELMKGKPPSRLPEGYVHASALLTDFQAYQVSLWNEENRKQVLASKKRKLRK